MSLVLPENNPYRAEKAATAPAFREGSQIAKMEIVQRAQIGMNILNLNPPTSISRDSEAPGTYSHTHEP